MQKIIEIRQGVTRHPDYRLAHALSLTLYEGEPVAICGPNGGGKSLLVDILTGAHPLLGDALTCPTLQTPDGRTSAAVRHITFRDVYGAVEPAYYQQRWNRGDEMLFPTVRAQLTQVCDREGITLDDRMDLLQAIGIAAHLDKEVNLLSSGELRRFQLSKVLLENPRFLIIDNPYIGLDVAARQSFTEILQALTAKLTLLLVVSRPKDIPAFVSKVIHVADLTVSAPVDRDTYLAAHPALPAATPKAVVLPEGESAGKPFEGNSVAQFCNIHISYGARKIFDGLNWDVHRGEHWAIMGRNGSGKTTLLSLVCADNPIAYACDIRLFGTKRGGGESIWDIKRRIGYVSPEMYSAYKKDLTALEIVASGLHDTIGLYSRTRPEDVDVCMAWLDTFGAADLAHRSYLRLSSGQQRLILLVRAFVKQPDLLILDEPFHGLDDVRQQLARDIIEAYMKNPDKTLIMVTHYKDELPPCIDHTLNL